MSTSISSNITIPSLPTPTLAIPSAIPHKILHHTAASIPSSLLESCFNLIENTSKTAYTTSNRGWSTRLKRDEMGEKDMRYLVIISDSEPLYNLLGFLSYQLTSDSDSDGNSIPVIYIYEIHLTASLRNLGIGAILMSAAEEIGIGSGMRKAMLTVFLSNERGIRFYERLGYEVWDEEYVEPTRKRRLRNGETKEVLRLPSYIIMAKELVSKGGDGV